MTGFFFARLVVAEAFARGNIEVSAPKPSGRLVE